jgi:predicted cupin superfamily sugar epimerase
MRTGIALSCLAVAAILTGCGSSSGTTTVTAPAEAATTATPSTATTAAAPGTSSSVFSSPDGVPAYQPSTIVSEGPGSLRIISDESVTQVGAYYASTFSSEGWVLVSKTVTPGGASFTLHENGQEVTVAVYPTASGSGVLISSSGLSSLDDVPVYQPSAILSEGPTSIRVISDNSVTQVGAYYASTFRSGGWVIVSKTVTPYSASFTVKKSGQAATVAVYPNGAGSAVLISSYTLP